MLTSDAGKTQGVKLDKTYVVCRRLDRDIVHNFQWIRCILETSYANENVFKRNQ